MSLRHGYLSCHSLLYFNIEMFKTICHLIFSLLQHSNSVSSQEITICRLDTYLIRNF